MAISGTTAICMERHSSNDSRLHVVEPQIANRSQLMRPGPSSSRSSFLMESSQLYAATLTHYSTEPLTTGPNYDPLLLLLALAGDVHPNPGPSRYPYSVCFKNVTNQGTSVPVYKMFAMGTFKMFWSSKRCGLS